MIGVELDGDSAPVRKKLLFDEKIFVGSSSNKNVLRLLPALNITKAHADLFLNALNRILTAN